MKNENTSGIIIKSLISLSIYYINSDIFFQQIQFSLNIVNKNLLQICIWLFKFCYFFFHSTLIINITPSGFEIC